MIFDIDWQQKQAPSRLRGRQRERLNRIGRNYIDGMEKKTDNSEIPMGSALQNVSAETRNWLKTTWLAIIGNNGKAADGSVEHDLGAVPEKTVSVIKNAYGKDVTRQIITAKGVEHIYEQHGKNPQKEIKDGQIPINADNVSLIADVLATPDTVKPGHPTRTTGNYDTVIISKKYADGTVHVVDAIIDGDTLKVWTAYIWDINKTNGAYLASSRKPAASPATMPLEPSLDPNTPKTTLPII